MAFWLELQHGSSQVSSMPAHPVEFGLASFHNHMSQSLRVNQSLSPPLSPYIYIYGRSRCILHSGFSGPGIWGSVATCFVAISKINSCNSHLGPLNLFFTIYGGERGKQLTLLALDIYYNQFFEKIWNYAGKGMNDRSLSYSFSQSDLNFKTGWIFLGFHFCALYFCEFFIYSHIYW